MIGAEEVVDKGKVSLLLPGEKVAISVAVPITLSGNAPESSVILAKVRVTPLLIVYIITVYDREMTEIVVKSV